MARAYGANASLLAAFESTYGSTPVNGYWQLPFVSTSLGSEQGLIANDLIGLGRDPSAPIRDVIKVEGDMVVPLDVRHIGLWLKALLGEPTSVGTGVVTHTFTSGKPSLPSLTLETGLPDIPAWFVASGVMVNSLQVGFARSGAANATVGLVAQGEVRRTAPLDDTPATRELQRFNQFQGQILREGQALGNVVSAQLPVLAGITQIVAGRERYTAHYAVKNDGTLYSWGYNGNGQLGDGSSNQANVAMPRAGGSLAGKTIVKVFGAYVHAFALDSTGALHAWGTNDYGQLGNGNLANQFTPVQVATNVADAYTGSYDYPLTYLKKTDKTLWACGAGAYWGNANGSNSGNFVQVPVGNAVVKAVHGGTGSYNYGAALLENGTVYAWGYNGNGALGLGDATNRSSVELVRIAQRRVVDLSSYGSSSEQGLVFLLDDGQVLASGYAGEAQLPEDDSETSYVPYPVIL